MEKMFKTYVLETRFFFFFYISCLLCRSLSRLFCVEYGDFSQGVGTYQILLKAADGSEHLKRVKLQ